ncbi:MAG: hypothetical protein B6I20_08590 [Bacteroidetes bacterium 4572_117]|nr:MAG: hypothetical protein B6I20_08590 [Bacteroidetes bacterium 4572_117]
MKKYIIIVIILLNFSNVYGQNGIHSKITTLTGSSVFFPFNSYTKLYEGMEAGYTNWTRFRILYFDTIAGGGLDGSSHWELMVRANTGNIVGDGSVSPMTLDKVELLVTYTNDVGLTVTTPYTITGTDTQIIGNGTNPTGTTVGATVGPNTEVQVSYRVGRNGAPPAANTLLGEASGYYFVDLVFTLRKE